MPDPGVEGIQVPLVLVQRVRRILQDYSETNELHQGEELTDKDLARDLVDVIDDWNDTPPNLNFSLTPTLLSTLPGYGGPRRWIVDMAVARALRVLILKHARNDVSFVSGNVTIRPHEIWRNLEAIASRYETMYETRKKEFKVSRNIDNAYSVAHTELFYGYDAGSDGSAFVLI